tara:strand:+ start:20845 stop:21276 length:432 start_codon:yes stop_codon:yes gene_type:complete
MHRLTVAFKIAADVHPALLRWFDEKVLANPAIGKWLAMAAVIMVWHLERSDLNPDAAYQRYLLTLNAVSGEAAPAELDQETFSELMHSMSRDQEIASVLMQEPLLVEHGRVGTYRRDLWAQGLREPAVTRTIMSADGLFGPIR